MKILVLSDLHLEFGDFVPPQVAADVVILGGDIWKRDAGIRWGSTHFPPTRTIYIVGNHEFYGEEYEDVLAACRLAAKETGVAFLENETIELLGVRFIGATLWSDFRLHGVDEELRSMREAQRMINDYRVIRVIDDRGQRRLSPSDTRARHKTSRAFLKSELDQPFSGKTVVLTHFMPAPASIAAKFTGDSVNPYFCSDLQELIEETQPDLWIHGHTHESCDYQIGRTRVVCNPRGYYPHELNPAFDPKLTIEI